MIVFCENCQVNYNDKSSDTGKCPLCTKSVKQYLKAPNYYKGDPTKQSIKQGVNNLIKESAKKRLGGSNDYFLNSTAPGKRKVGKQP